MSIKLTDKQEQIIQDLTDKINKIRLDQYEKAVEKLEEVHKESVTLSDKISRGELNNLVVARPREPKRPEFMTEDDVQKYIRRLRNDEAYGVEKAQQRFLENYADSVAKAWGVDLAQEVMNLARTNPDKFIALVNSKELKSIKFVYSISDSQAINDYMDTLKKALSVSADEDEDEE